MKLSTIREKIWEKDFFEGKHEILAEIDQVLSINTQADLSCLDSFSIGTKAAIQANLPKIYLTTRVELSLEDLENSYEDWIECNVMEDETPIPFKEYLLTQNITLEEFRAQIGGKIDNFSYLSPTNVSFSLEDDKGKEIISLS